MKLESLKRDKILTGKILDGEHYVFLSRCISSLPVDIYLDTKGIITDRVYGIWFRIAHPASKEMQFHYYSFLDTNGTFYIKRDLILLTDAELKELSGFAVYMKKQLPALSRGRITLSSLLRKMIKQDMHYSPFSPMKRIKPPECHYRYWIALSTELARLFGEQKECHKVPGVLVEDILGLKNSPIIEDDGFHYKETNDFTRPFIIYAFDDKEVVDRVNRIVDTKYHYVFENWPYGETEIEEARNTIEKIYSLDEDGIINELFPDWRRALIEAKNKIALSPGYDKEKEDSSIHDADCLLEMNLSAIAHPLYL